MNHIGIAYGRLIGTLLAGFLFAGSALAGRGQPGEQVAGYYRQQVGDAVVTALYDGHIELDSKLLKGVQARDLQALMARMFVQDRGGVQTAVNAFLVDTPNHVVLVDAGAASCFGPSMGKLRGNLKAAGYKPEDVDVILLTHLHPDHICGLVKDGQVAFPNAQVWASERDARYWLSEEVAAKAPEGKRPFFKMAREIMAPYQAKRAFHTYTEGWALPAGFSVVPTPGHTPGHSSYLFVSREQSLLIWGDIVHSHAVQFARPEVSIDFDSDQRLAIKSRQAVLAQAMAKGWMIAGAHLPFPGLGHVRKEGNGYAWVPVEFSPLKRDR